MGRGRVLFANQAICSFIPSPPPFGGEGIETTPLATIFPLNPISSRLLRKGFAFSAVIKNVE
jgi:hypothetical protein